MAFIIFIIAWLSLLVIHSTTAGEPEENSPAQYLAWLAIVVVFVIQREHWQAVGRQFFTDRMRFDDIGRLVQCMGQRRGVKVTTTFSKVGINVEPGIGATRIMIQTHHFARCVKILVQRHLFPVVQAEIARRAGILPAKREIGISHGSQLHSRHRLPQRVEDRKVRIER